MGLSRIYSEYLSEKMTGSQALRKAMIEARDLEFDIEKEPQIKKEKEPGDISLEHPFFWSGFLVVDQPRLKAAAVAPGNQMPGMKKPPATTPATPAQTPPAGTSPTPLGSGNKNTDGSGNKNTDPSGSGSKTTDKPDPAVVPEKPAAESGSGTKAAPKKAGGVF